jgi:CRISPR-associated endonuclease Csn1
MRQNEDYFLGLDLGTGSLGWAVTDTNYNLLRAKGKALWGIRLFESAETAIECRGYRSVRRNIFRKKWRAKLFEELFASEIAKVDPAFFIRLKESRLWEDDRSDENRQKNSLFFDKNFDDKAYFKEYKTIYHLRKALIEGKKKFDIRLIYLALKHILKHRGHFLFEGLNAKDVTDFKKIFDDFKEYLEHENDQIGFIQVNDSNSFETILKNRELGKQDKKKLLAKVLDDDNKKRKTAICGLLAGSDNVKIADLYSDEDLNESENAQISFNNPDIDLVIDALRAELGDKVEFIVKLKELYDWSILVNILANETYISFAKVKTYEQHAKDLKDLKEIVAKYYPDSKDRIFGNPNDGATKSSKLTNYSSYIGMFKKNKKKGIVEVAKCSREVLCDFLKKELKGLDKKDDQLAKEVYKKIENKTFLPKQVSVENSVIPNQLHLVEAKKIIENASKYYPFLEEKDKDGISVTEKILDIIKFRIPYYVGPLAGTEISKEKGRFWSVRKEYDGNEEKITPWNFDKLIDKEKCAEAFIRNMTNKCTYLAGEDVLPKYSLLYSEFMVLNEINNLKIDGEKIPVDVKQRLYKDLFVDQGKNGLTKKQIKKYLATENIKGEISGVDDKIKSNLKSYHDFLNIFGKENFPKREIVEKIILWITLIGSEKAMLEKKVKELLPNITKNQIKKIKSLRYDGWGRLSKELLDSSRDKANVVFVNTSTGEIFTIISALKHTNLNLMELLGNECEYKFIDRINKYNSTKVENKSKFDYKMVEELYVSPAVKRQIWQTLLIVQELKKVLGREPKKIFVEMAREEGEKKRTESRRDNLYNLYKSCKKGIDGIPKEEIDKLFSGLEKATDQDLLSRKLYLYYTQLGRDMYDWTKRIDINSLNNSNIWDKDHIYPRSKTKDDSLLNNLVLVNKKDNAGVKKDDYPLPPSFQAKNAKFWKILLDKKLITREKYDRLTRTSKLSNSELAGFINRQLVETRQSTKAVATMLKSNFLNTKIVYAKAGNVSAFRQNFDIVKCRELNDYHHAKDAYLNVVVGNAYDVKFTSTPLKFIEGGEKYTLNTDALFNRTIKRGNNIAWQPGEDGTIKTVRQVLDKNNILFTRMVHENKGQMFDLLPLKKTSENIDKRIPLKKYLPVEKYGYYNTANSAYFTVVESKDKKDKLIRTIETIPIYKSKELENEEKLLEYLINKCELKEPRVLIPKLKVRSLLIVDGFPMHIAGKTGNRVVLWGAGELLLPNNFEKYLKKVVKYCNESKIYNAKNKTEFMPITKRFNFDKDTNIQIYKKIVDKFNTRMFKNRPTSPAKNLKTWSDKFEHLEIYNQVIVLNELLKLFKNTNGNANLKLLGGATSSGNILMLKNFSNKKEVILVNQSPTGLFEKRINLLKI